MNIILAIDLGKFNSILCWYDPHSRDAAFTTIRSSADEFARRVGNSNRCFRGAPG
jgi:hypothetical protein